MNNYGYEYAYVIPTTQSQDETIEDQFQMEAKKNYTFWHQCAIVVQNALNAGNIKSIDVSYLYFDDDYPKVNVPYTPLRTFINIFNNNPKGKIITRK